MLEEGSYYRGINLSKLVKGLILLLAWKPCLFGVRSTTYKTYYDVSWERYETDMKDQSILFNHQAQSRLRSAVGTVSLQNILIPTETTWND